MSETYCPKCEAMCSSKHCPETQYRDIDGNPCSLETLCQREPGWAASRIREWRNQVGRLTEELSELRRAQQPEVPSTADRATVELWDVGRSAQDVISQEQYCGYASEDDAASDLDDDEHAYHITVTVERVGQEPAQPAAPSFATKGEMAAYHAGASGELSAADLARAAVAIDKAGVKFVGAEAPSPDVERAIAWLRSQQEQRCDIIAAALDRLRAENTQLRLDVAAVTEDFQQLTRECGVLRDERDRLKLYEPRFHAALMDLRDVVRDALICERIIDLTAAVSLSQAAERATKVLDGGEGDGEMTRLCAFAAKVRKINETETDLGDFSDKVIAALAELDRGKAGT